MKIGKNEKFYIIWAKELPIIESNLYSILNAIDDVSAVEADTWLLSSDFNEIIEFHHEGKIISGRLV